ncbi:MAG: thermonuclease family protein [Candidatus Paceibacterota bacterium]|nr:MAG: thermonuclease family protein [Candidatus Paceibacterota bacterium]
MLFKNIGLILLGGVLFLTLFSESPKEEGEESALLIQAIETGDVTLSPSVTPSVLPKSTPTLTPRAERSTQQPTLQQSAPVSTPPFLQTQSPQSLPNVFIVTRVVDGDTIDVDYNGTIERVRYIGIDTPETVDPRKPVQCFGKEASRRNTELVLGKSVRLEKDVTDRDAYGRLLRYVYVGDFFVNLELVKNGFAKVYTYPPDVKYDSVFLAAQTEARNSATGLWGVACSTTTTPAPAQAATPTLAPQSGTCDIKGNISSSGEKIYHVEGCRSYNATKINEDAGERWFCSESEALSAGWRKALNCN